MDGDYYHILEVAPDASQEEIKKAFRAAVRKYPPEKYPETFKTIQAAYDALSKPSRRQEYNKERVSQPLLEKASKAFEYQSYNQAENLLLDYLRIDPDNIDANLLILNTYFKLDKFRSIQKHLNIILNTKFNNPSFYTSCANISLQCHDKTKDIVFIELARFLCKESINHEKINAEAFFLIGMAYFIEKLYVLAFDNYEKAILADNTINHQDIEPSKFMFLCSLLTRSENLLDRLFVSINSINKDNCDLRNYFGYELYTVFGDFIKSSDDLTDNYLRKMLNHFISLSSGELRNEFSKILKQMNNSSCRTRTPRTYSHPSENYQKTTDYSAITIIGGILLFIPISILLLSILEPCTEFIGALFSYVGAILSSILEFISSFLDYMF